LIFLAFVVPLALYCFFLAFINRRPHPVVIPASWDFAALLAAVSGLVLCGGPAILSKLYLHLQYEWILNRSSIIPEQGFHWGMWATVWSMYFTLVLAGALLLIRSRRGATSIYNALAERVQFLLETALDRANVPWKKIDGGQFLVSVPHPELLPAKSDREPTCWVPIRTDYFRLMHHATLFWPRETKALQELVEPELIDLLAQEVAPSNQLGNWLFSVALMLTSSAFLALVGLIIVQVLFVLHR